MGIRTCTFEIYSSEGKDEGVYFPDERISEQNLLCEWRWGDWGVIRYNSVYREWVKVINSVRDIRCVLSLGKSFWNVTPLEQEECAAFVKLRLQSIAKGINDNLEGWKKSRVHHHSNFSLVFPRYLLSLILPEQDTGGWTLNLVITETMNRILVPYCNRGRVGERIDKVCKTVLRRQGLKELSAYIILSTVTPEFYW